MIRTGAPLARRNIACKICGGTLWQSDNYMYHNDELVHRTCYTGARKIVGEPLQAEINELKAQIEKKKAL